MSLTLRSCKLSRVSPRLVCWWHHSSQDIQYILATIRAYNRIGLSCFKRWSASGALEHHTWHQPSKSTVKLAIFPSVKYMVSKHPLSAISYTNRLIKYHLLLGDHWVVQNINHWHTKVVVASTSQPHLQLWNLSTHLVCCKLTYLRKPTLVFTQYRTKLININHTG